MGSKPIVFNNTGFGYFNIHHEGVIPYLNIRGPVYNINLNKNTYTKVFRSGIKIYQVSDDPIMTEMKKKKLEKQIEAREAELDKIKAEEDARNTAEELERQRAEKLAEEIRLRKEAEEALKQFEAGIVQPFDDATDVDEELLNSEIKVKIDPYGNVIRVEEDEMIDEVVEEAPVVEKETTPEAPKKIKISNKKSESTQIKYTKKTLLTLTNQQLKDILIERGHEGPEDPLSPRYHDTKAKLIDKVLKTEK